MTIAIICSTHFEDYDLFKTELDKLDATLFVYAQSSARRLLERYAQEVRPVTIEKETTSRIRLQRIYTAVRRGDMALFFYVDDPEHSAMTKKAIAHARNQGVAHKCYPIQK